MKVPQLSLFVENRPGQLRVPCQVLAEAGISILTLCLYGGGWLPFFGFLAPSCFSRLFGSGSVFSFCSMYTPREQRRGYHDVRILTSTR